MSSSAVPPNTVLIWLMLAWPGVEAGVVGTTDGEGRGEVKTPGQLARGGAAERVVILEA